MPRQTEKPVYVYVWYRPDSGVPFYVGIGVGKRAWSLSRRNAHALNIVRKYGGIDGIRVVTRSVESWEAGLLEEQRLIASIGRKSRQQGPLTNETDGGEGALGRAATDKTRRAVGAANSKRSWTVEQRARMGSAMTGRLVSVETRSKLKTAFSGKPRPERIKAILLENLKKAALTGSGGWIGSKENRDQLAAAQKNAKVWHASDAGREAHAKIGRQSWIDRPWVDKTCEQCGTVFKTPYPTRARFCHQNCKMIARRRRLGIVGPGRRIQPGAPPKKRGVVPAK